MNIVEEILAAIPEADTPRIAWGQVIDVGPPLEVRFAGDTGSTVIKLKNSDVTLADTNKVLLIKAGSQWIIVCKIGST